MTDGMAEHEVPGPERWIRRVHPPLTASELGTFDEVNEDIRCTVVVLARNEERCIARCLDSVVRRGFDDIVVVDTGSTDGTPRIVDGYRDLGVRLLRTPWQNSFARARNFAIDFVAAGWIVFLDADEWLRGETPERLLSCLKSLSASVDTSRLAFAPLIVDAGRDESTDEVPRIFRADSRIRYKGAVHEYLVVDSDVQTPVDLVSLDMEFRHDGYDVAVLHAKKKAERNLRLLDIARAADPQNPRWLYFTIRNPLSVSRNMPVAALCDAIGALADTPSDTGDRKSAKDYHRLSLALACQSLALRGDWPTVFRHCSLMDHIDQGESADGCYFRFLFQLLHGEVTDDDLGSAIAVRQDTDMLAKSTICSSGRHVDAVIAAFLEQCRNVETADRYRDMCNPWTDVFFDRAHLRDMFVNAWARSLEGI